MSNGRSGGVPGAADPAEPRAGEPLDRPPRARLEFVQKRDGRLVPFQRHKIAEAVHKAMEAAGESDPVFASEVASIVELALLERRGSGGALDVPHIETIQDLVERALMDLGRAAVAKAYILHRDRRARVRSALRVHRSDTLRSPVRVREREGVSDWSKGRIVAALMQEAELARESAEDVAAAVERRVFAAGKRTVTTGLLRELVSSELFERGWLGALSSSRSVGLSRLDVARALDGQPLHPWAAVAPGGSAARAAPRTAEMLAGELLTRYALESVLSEPASELHRAGDLHVVGLESLGRPLSLCVDAELLAGGGDPASSAGALLDSLAELAPTVARVLVLEHPAAVLAPLARTTRENSPHGLAAWLRSAQALARGAGVRIDLGTLGARYHAFGPRLVEELSELPASAQGPRLFLDGAELEALLEERGDLAPRVGRLLAEDRLVPTWNGTAWNGPEEVFAGPGCTRRANERGALACAGAIALDLPRIARRVGAFREELLQSALAELVAAAVEIAGSLRATAERCLARSGLRARSSFALVPVGLREALWILGDGAIDTESCARLLGFLGEAARRFSRDELLEPLPCPFFGAEAAARFAFQDARAARAAGARQEWLFDEAEADLGASLPYTQGFRLSPLGAVPPGRAEAEGLKTVPAGALLLGDIAARVEESAPGRGGESALAAWKRFELLRRARSGELSLELFPRPRLAAQAPARRAVSPSVPATDRGRDAPAPAPLRPLD